VRRVEHDRHHRANGVQVGIDDDFATARSSAVRVQDTQQFVVIQNA
jgi:hypothetical protein